MSQSWTSTLLAEIKQKITEQAKTMGFEDCRITAIDEQILRPYVAQYQQWTAAQLHGSMEYMVRHGRMREAPDILQTGSVRAITVRFEYLPESHEAMWEVMSQPEKAYISRYAVGQDYHKKMRNKLQKLGESIKALVGDYGYRAFVDSAPVLEKPLAENAGLGWIGKHTNIINRNHGSWFFLGELLVDIPLEPDQSEASHCGSCHACLDVCPTGAIIAPYLLDARRCISYLTIEYKGSIPKHLRQLMGNRIYGCDDCQLVCPWNKFAKVVEPERFSPRENLKSPDLLSLFALTEAQFLKQFEGSPIRRIGYQSWLRNIAIAMGNAPYSPAMILALQSAKTLAEDVLAETIDWAVEQQQLKETTQLTAAVNQVQ
jgi:epoxyqueuosine reductase